MLADRTQQQEARGHSGLAGSRLPAGYHLSLHLIECTNVCIEECIRCSLTTITEPFDEREDRPVRRWRKDGRAPVEKPRKVRLSSRARRAQRGRSPAAEGTTWT